MSPIRDSLFVSRVTSLRDEKKSAKLALENSSGALTVIVSTDGTVLGRDLQAINREKAVIRNKRDRMK